MPPFVVFPDFPLSDSQPVLNAVPLAVRIAKPKLLVAQGTFHGLGVRERVANRRLSVHNFRERYSHSKRSSGSQGKQKGQRKPFGEFRQPLVPTVVVAILLLERRLPQPELAAPGKEKARQTSTGLGDAGLRSHR